METATKVKYDRMSRVLASLGVRMVGGDIAETPEKMRENGHGRNDRRTDKDVMQNVNQDHDNGV